MVYTFKKDNLPEELRRGLRKGLKRARKEKYGTKYTQADLAKEESINVSEKTIMNWEQGRIDLPISTLWKLAKLYDCSIDYLIGETDCKTIETELICKMTGLSKEAATVLQNLQKNTNLFGKQVITAINDLISSIDVEKPATSVLCDIYQFMYSRLEVVPSILDQPIEYQFVSVDPSGIAKPESDSKEKEKLSQSFYKDRIYDKLTGIAKKKHNKLLKQESATAADHIKERKAKHEKHKQ